MKAHEYAILRETFEHARQSTAAETQKLVDNLHTEHPTVAKRLQRMLAVLEDNRVGTITALSTAEADTATAMIGPYKLLGRIGEGSSGVVYLGQQSSPVHRLLAIKLLHPNQATDGNLRRFELEQQILATLDHSGIVTMVGSGVEERGLPYLVMPLVPGVAITEFCRQEELSIEARVKLFASTCRAVQHAHSHGVIHRDLKPGNILVSMVDGVPVSKVIDFGIAKIADSGGRDATSGTQPIGTLRYMCPEQVLCKQPTVQNDVYSLGAVLYEMLTEMPVNAADSEIAPPSLKSERDIPRELDWIVLKAVAHEPSRRYSTVNELCDDLERFGRGETVAAGPPAKVYRMVRWLRHRLPLAITGGIALATVVMGTGISWNFAVREHEARIKAEDSFDVLAEFLSELDPYVALGKDRQKLREALEASVQRLNQNSNSPNRSSLCRIYGLALANVGDSQRALPLLLEAEAITRHSEISGVQRLNTLMAIVRIYCDDDREQDGRQYLAEIKTIACEQLNDERTCLGAELLRYRVTRHEVPLEELAAHAHKLSTRLGPSDPFTIAAERMSLRKIFSTEKELDSEKRARVRADVTAALRNCRERAERLCGRSHPFVYEDISLEAWGILDGKDGAPKIVAFANELLADTEKYLGRLHRTTILFRGNLALGCSLTGDHERALKENQRALQDAEEYKGKLSEVCEQVRRERIEILQRAGRHDEAIKLAHELDVLRGGNNPEPALILARVYELAGEPDKAAWWWEEYLRR